MNVDDRNLASKASWKRAAWLIPALVGFPSLVWFLVRVIPKPSRAGYPCMRVAAPVASSFVLWCLGLSGSIVALRNAAHLIRKARYVWAGICLIAGILVAGLGFMGTSGPPIAAYQGIVEESGDPTDPVNEPMGEPKGLSPGRVVWVHDPDATDWGGPESGEPCWSPDHTDQAVVDSMMSRAIQWLAGKPTDEEAWEALFTHFNRERGKGELGYVAGERIAIKINLTTCNASGWSKNREDRTRTSHLDKAGDTSPQLILALLRQLVQGVGVDQEDVSVGDPVSFFPDQWYQYLAQEFPGVHYLDLWGFPGRTVVDFSDVPLYWSTEDALGKLQDYLPTAFAEADYIMNLAVLKGHAVGITLCAKNHYGSLIRNPKGRLRGLALDYYNLHDKLPWHLGTPGRGHYRPLVDLMGHKELGAKTVLYLVDGLYGGYYWEGTPYRWKMSPFNGDWPSSLFSSQDPVAIDSVAYDFLRAEWPSVVEDGDWVQGSLEGGAQDYLHEAALAGNPPSGTFYDPEADGTLMGSLGVHEHWDSVEEKRYSRNLGTARGIELVSSEPVILVPCEADWDTDGDVDGVDLAALAQALSEVPISVMEEEFGRLDCPRPWELPNS